MGSFLIQIGIQERTVLGNKEGKQSGRGTGGRGGNFRVRHLATWSLGDLGMDTPNGNIALEDNTMDLRQDIHLGVIDIYWNE